MTDDSLLHAENQRCLVHTKYCAQGPFSRTSKPQENVVVNSHFVLWIGWDNDLTIIFVKEESEM